MTGPGPDWVSLREYIERVLVEREKALTVAMEAQQRALDLRERNLEDRLENLNELRREVMEDRAKFLTSEVYSVEHRALIVKVEEMSKDKQRQLDDLKRSRAIFVGVGMVMVPLAGLIGAALMKAFS